MEREKSERNSMQTTTNMRKDEEEAEEKATEKRNVYGEWWQCYLACGSWCRCCCRCFYCWFWYYSRCTFVWVRMLSVKALTHIGLLYSY